MSTIIFRADASVQIGYGHVMRCLSLADEIITRNWETVFICRDLPGNLFTEIENRGHSLIKLPRVENYFNGTIAENDYTAKLGVTWEHDADDTIMAIDSSGLDPRWLVVDHYGLDIKWEKRFRNKVEKILVIDDLVEQPHECDILLNQNFLSEVEDSCRSLVPETATLLLGPKYALLRHEFFELRKALKPRDGNVRQVLLFYGGVDSTNQTSKALRAIKGLNRPDIHFDVVIGSFNRNRASIEKQINDIPNTTFHIQLPHLADLMSNSDLALGAAGSTTWERLCLGLPTLVTTVAENQLPATKHLDRLGLIIWLGNAIDVKAINIEEKLIEVLEEPKSLYRQSVKALQLIDGRGVLRIVDKLVSELGSLHLRPVKKEDEGLLLKWANDLQVRRQAFNQEMITKKEHSDWFAKRIDDPNTKIWILEDNKIPIGQIRWEASNFEAILDYSIESTFRGKGFGSSILKMGIQEILKIWPNVTLKAEVRNKNISSVNAIKSAGFEEIGNENNVIIYKRSNRTTNTQ